MAKEVSNLATNLSNMSNGLLEIYTFEVIRIANQYPTIKSIARTSKVNDEETDIHVICVGEFGFLLAHHMGLNPEFSSNIPLPIGGNDQYLEYILKESDSKLYAHKMKVKTKIE